MFCSLYAQKDRLKWLHVGNHADAFMAPHPQHKLTRDQIRSGREELVAHGSLYRSCWPSRQDRWSPR